MNSAWALNEIFNIGYVFEISLFITHFSISFVHSAYTSLYYTYNHRRNCKNYEEKWYNFSAFFSADNCLVKFSRELQLLVSYNFLRVASSRELQLLVRIQTLEGDNIPFFLRTFNRSIVWFVTDIPRITSRQFKFLATIFISTTTFVYSNFRFYMLTSKKSLWTKSLNNLERNIGLSNINKK